ncbi:MAG TPA: hypothetical protein VK669_10405 [Candidatus Limnocylindrales bacterium]|nr:hypothetical protein [Candidatus Limnocylindrales bacterium]
MRVLASLAIIASILAGSATTALSKPNSPAALASRPDETLDWYNVVPGWGDALLQITGGRKPLFIIYDELRYDDATLGVTDTVIAGPDFSKIFSVNGLASGGGGSTVEQILRSEGRAVQYAPTDPVFTVVKEANPATRGAGCARSDLGCRVRLYNAAATALATVFRRDADAIELGKSEVFQQVARFDARLRTMTASDATSDTPLFLAEPPADGNAAQEPAARTTLLKEARTEARTLSERLALTPRPDRTKPGNVATLPDYRLVLADNPATCTIEQGDPQNSTYHIASPFIELNDACADLLSADRADLLQAVSSSASADKDALKALLPDVSTFQLNFGGTAGTVRGAMGTNLDLLQTWTNRFSNVGAMKFYVRTDNTGCTSSFNGVTHLVHFKASDAVPASFGGGKNIDRDVVAINCNPAYMKSLGMGYSALPTVTYNVASLAISTAPGTFTTTNTLRSSSDTGRTIGALLAHRCLCPNPGDSLNSAFSFGLGASAKDATELIAGFSVVSQRKFFLTLGAHYGGVNTLLPGQNKPGDTVPSGYSPTTVKQYQTRFTAVLSVGI